MDNRSGTHTMTNPAPTSRYHYARMRCAEDAARSLSVRHSVHTVLGGLTVIPREQAEFAAVRDSYYLLAAAHRNAARRIERRACRALAWSDFKAHPFLQIGVMAGDRARGVRRKACRLVRSVRRAVNV